MCNAWGHSIGCTCGWGGEGHLGRPNGGFQAPASRPPTILQAQFPLAVSFTRPNATCPECGVSVYFYQSPAGGRVFFDELGPPWPKHPCTDRSTTFSGKVSVVAPTSGPDREKPRWIDEGWVPFICSQVGAGTGGVGYCRLDGVLGDTRTTIYLCTTTLPDAALLQVRRARPNEFDVYIVWIESATHRMRSAKLKAFTHSFLAAEWCAKEAKSRGPRSSRIVQSVVVKGSSTPFQPTLPRKDSREAGKSRPVQGGALKGKGAQSRLTQSHFDKAGSSKKENVASVRKEPNVGFADSSARKQPKEPSAINAMGLAYEKARERKKS